MALLAIVCLLAVLAFIFYKPLEIKKIPLANQPWSQPPGLVTISFGEEKSHVTVFRLKDGRDENLTGSWNINYLTPSSIALYGSFPPDMATSTPETKRHLFILTERGGERKNISKLPGEIVSIEQNPIETYFLIFGVKENAKTKSLEPYACVAEKLKPTMSPCKEVLGEIFKKGEFDPKVQHKIFWDKKSDRQIVIQELGGKGQVFTFDPWNEKPLLVTGEEQTKLIKDNLETKVALEPNFTFSRWGGFILFKNASHIPIGLTKIPKDSKTLWITPDILLYTKGKDMYIINLEKKLESLFTYLPPSTYMISTMNSSVQW